ncbi:hypothetical protein TEA_017169 [Camellia sinensis var. sinensis]|uniref:GDSL esterase/lipase n=1 Tax=Camellia sinensis var. sinensis TaxID=542762 RepID=A0A4S4EPP3_CAMSN|nr:hypothetical protein TEA_017169 [Camellia sinensis var. sinensis]
MGVLLGRPIVGITFRILIILVFSGICLGEDVPANFVFGDSLVEVGNNDYIVSLSKADYAPFGIDFGKPTGRYTNGRTIVDIIGKFSLIVTFAIDIPQRQEIGLKDFTPPYLAPTTTGPVVLQGVNYASGGGGILNHTGKIFVREEKALFLNPDFLFNVGMSLLVLKFVVELEEGGVVGPLMVGARINLDAQMDNFANTRQDIISNIGAPAALKMFEKALFSITIGANDFINNYLTPVVSALEQKLVPPETFVDTLISRFRLQLTRLYNMGARNIVVANVGPIGCIPYQRDINPSAGESCVAFPNQLAQLFNAQLKDLLAELSANLKESKFLYANVYRLFEDIIKNHISYGFENANSACCAISGRFGGLIPCGPSAKVCPDRSKYVFWDPYHPTDAANAIIAKRLTDGGSDDIWPMNIRHVAQALLLRFLSSEVSHVCRDGNSVAHCLSRLAFDFESPRIWMEEVPSSLMALVMSEASSSV